VTPTASFRTAAKDRLAPTVKITGLKKKVTRRALLKGLRLTLTPSEPAKLAIGLRGSKTSRHPRYTVRLASKSFGLGGKRRLTLKPKRSRVRRATPVRLTIAATDAAGNRRRITRTIKVAA
jgi:hypothetical protein